MSPESGATAIAEPASFVVVDPNGHRKRVPVDPIPFLIGRQPENHLILRDSRVSRSHARIVVENGAYKGSLSDGKWQHRKVAAELLAGPML